MWSVNYFILGENVGQYLEDIVSLISHWLLSGEYCFTFQEMGKKYMSTAFTFISGGSEGGAGEAPPWSNFL